MSLQINYGTVRLEDDRDWISLVFDCHGVKRVFEEKKKQKKKTPSRCWRTVTRATSNGVESERPSRWAFSARPSCSCRASIKTSHINRVSVALTPVCCCDRELRRSYLPAMSPWRMAPRALLISLPLRSLSFSPFFLSPQSALCCFSIFSRRPSKESIFILIWVSSRLMVCSWSVFTAEAQKHRNKGHL